MLRRLTQRLFVVDVLTVAFSAALVLVALVFRGRVAGWAGVAAVSAAIVVGLPALAAARSAHPWPALAFLHDWAFAPLAYVLYLQVNLLVRPLRGGWVADPALISMDRWLFGGDAAALLGAAAFPPLTELLQIAYTSFYLLVVAVGAELWLRGDARRFHLYAFSCAVGFFLSFLGYLAVPAVGPRFTLFDIATVERELPGLWLTPALRAFVDGGGLVPPGLSREAAMALAPRDVFPSGHTLVTLVAVYWSWRFRLKVGWAVSALGALLVLGTVYLRYHYAVDVVAGFAFAAVTVAVTRPLHRGISTRLSARG